MVSFYYEDESTELNGYSKQKIEDFRKMMREYHVQVIEINGFADMNNTLEANKALSQKRVSLLVDALQIGEQEFIVNNYGRQKIVLNFTPFNWERVDLYYHKGEARSEVDIVTVLENTPGPTREEGPIPVPTKEEITYNAPIIIPIKFKGGGNTIERGSQPRLEQLHATLVQYPELNIHIRGHVCCGNNMRISKKRAKVVYAYLKEHGISKDRMTFKGYSNTMPLVFPETSAADRAANRRVDVIFSKN
jgi:outer membrane protein OmpA-like peptidoglycan-associated protein